MTTTFAPASSAIRCASFRSFQGWTRTTLTRSSFICRTSCARCCGQGGMPVAHRAIDPCRRHIEHLDTARGVDAADRAADDLRVVRALHGSIRPGVELEAVLDEQIRAPEPEHEAWADLDVVRVLAATGQGLDVDLVAADLLHERLEVRDRRHDAELV